MAISGNVFPWKTGNISLHPSPIFMWKLKGQRAFRGTTGTATQASIKNDLEVSITPKQSIWQNIAKWIGMATNLAASFLSFASSLVAATLLTVAGPAGIQAGHSLLPISP